MYIEVKPSIDYIGDGIQRKFTFPFDYLRKAFIKVSINDTPMDAFTVEGKEVTFDEPPALEARINIYRETSTTRLVSWADASVLRARDMNINDVQGLHLIEEQQVWTERNAVTLTEEQAYNFYNRIIENVADPVNDGDVVTLRYFKDTKTGILNEINNAKSEAIRISEAAKQDSINASTVAKGDIETLVSSATNTITNLVSDADNSFNQHILDMANAKIQSVDAVTTAKAQGIGDVNNAKNEALNTIGSAKSAAVSAANAEVNKARAWAEENAGTTPSLIGGAKSSKQWASFAESKANTATTQADRAKTEADRAATEASKVDMSNYYSKTETDNRYLKLSGGTITGALETNSSIAKNTNTSELNIFGGQGWSNGAVLTLRGKNNSYLGGSFSIGAYNAASDELYELVGKNDGSLLWNGGEIERVVSKGDNYIRYASGLQICWSDDVVSASTSGTTVTFPQPFSARPTIVATRTGSSQNYAYVSSDNATTTTKFTLRANSSSAIACQWLAVGYWK